MLAPPDPAVDGGADGPSRAAPAATDRETAAPPDQPPAAPPSFPDLVVTATPAGPRSRKSVVVAQRGDKCYRDVLDLNSASARSKFAAATMGAAFPDVETAGWPPDVQRDIDRQLLALAAVPPGPAEPPPAADISAAEDPRAAALEEMPPDVKDEAQQLLESPDLLAGVVRHLGAAGVVGERVLALTVYLVFASAQLRKPLAAIVRGTSSSGKSYVVSTAATLVPPEILFDATQITANALVYPPPDALRHRALLLGERPRAQNDETANGTRMLRELLSARKISKLVTVKIDEQFQSVKFEREGPVACVETTTRPNPFEEDANRTLLLATDESEEQTRRILAAMAARAANGPPADADRLRQVHHAIHRMLPRGEVVIPYALALRARYAVAGVEDRRHFDHLLGLIAAVALLHFRQRPQKPDGRVVATLRDYEVAARLAARPVAAARGGIGTAAAKVFEQLSAKFKGMIFSTPEAQSATALKKSAVCNKLNELEEAGLVEKAAVGRGSAPAQWQLTGRKPSVTGGLPDPRQVFDACPADCGLPDGYEPLDLSFLDEPPAVAETSTADPAQAPATPAAGSTIPGP
jgi:hypothetical protein